jgi:flagellar basal-body rod protein FlgC
MYDLVPIEIAASGMTAQRVRMAVIASNLANADSTRKADGTGPYQRGMVVVQASQLPAFENMLASEVEKSGSEGSLAMGDAEEDSQRSRWLLEDHLQGVQVKEVAKDTGVRQVYDPEHPDADAQGYVTYPDITVVQEMTDMVSASRNYEANVAVMKNTKDMVLQLVELLGSQ